jgi:hypothetical protein
MKSDNPFRSLDSIIYADGALHLSSLDVELLACAIDMLWKYVENTAPIDVIQDMTGTYAYRSMTSEEQVAPHSSGSMATYLIDVACLGPKEIPHDEIRKEEKEQVNDDK